MSTSLTPNVPAPAPSGDRRTATLSTLFLTVFLDLLGFGLVIPFLPGLARSLGASDFVATLPGSAYSLMQFLFIPIWGRLSDRVGRRPVLLWSIAASAIGMAILGFSSTLALLFVARLWSGVATANIAVAQAYIADVTPPDRRARGMATIGIAFGLGFILGPAVGGLLAGYPVLGHSGTLPAFVAAGLSTVNLLLAFRTLPESLPPATRAARSPRRAIPLDLAAARAAAHTPGVGAAVVVNFLLILWFAGMEQTFRLFNEDRFGISVRGTGVIFMMVGITSTIVQGGLVGRLARRYGEAALIRAGLLIQAVAFALLGASPRFGAASRGALYTSAVLIATGNAITTPTLPAFASRRTSADAQGLTLGTLQSASALGRVLGPAAGGILYASISPSAPYFAGSAGFIVAALIAFSRLRDQRSR
jgi:MFS family permease